MKRDMDLVRSILVAAEKSDGPLDVLFWSSGILTGNQTEAALSCGASWFWSSGILTGNQTRISRDGNAAGFGAVAF